MDDYTSLTFLLLAIAGTLTVAVKGKLAICMVFRHYFAILQLGPNITLCL